MRVDFEKVMKNAADQGISLQEITIQYEGLTFEELEFLKKHQRVIPDSERQGSVLAKFPVKGFPLYQEKATAVIYLGAS